MINFLTPIDAFLIVVGLVALIYSADLFISGAANIARNLNVSSLVIVLTVVSFGSSAPEALISLVASYEGT